MTLLRFLVAVEFHLNVMLHINKNPVANIFVVFYKMHGVLRL